MTHTNTTHLFCDTSTQQMQAMLIIHVLLENNKTVACFLRNYIILLSDCLCKLVAIKLKTKLKNLSVQQNINKNI